MESRFKTEREFLHAIDAQFADRHVPTEFRTALASGIGAAGQAISSDSHLNASAMNLKLGTWFIRKDDIPMFDALAAATGLVGTLVTAGVIAPAAAATGLANAAKMVWQVWRKGARLSQRQVLLLNVLNTKTAQSTEAVAAALNSGPEHLEEGEAAAGLHSLEMVELHDGTLVPLVRRDEDGRWRALDV